MFVNQILLRYENLLVFYLTFWNPRMLLITFSSENSQISQESVNF